MSFDFDFSYLDEPLDLDFDDDGGASIDEKKNAITPGYKMNQQGVKGRMLISRKSPGAELAMRLKDNGHENCTEVQFWAEMLAELATFIYSIAEFDYVTAPPSSGKRAYHLATDMAQRIAVITAIPYKRLYSNNTPRGHRATIQEKLREDKNYSYLGEPEKKILIIDDIIHTRKTARACIKATPKGRKLIRFIFLYG